jgi:hypothetical protein
LSVVALGACNTEPKTCDKVAGLYQPLYTYVDGGCGNIVNPNMVPFDGGLHGVNTIMQNLANTLVTTDIVMKGCTVHMTQKVQNREGGYLQSQIDGERIQIQDQNRLSGRVAVSMYDATGAPMCNGTYDAMFTKNGSTVGSAANGIGSAANDVGAAGHGP